MNKFASNKNIQAGVGCFIDESAQISDESHVVLGDHCYTHHLQ